MGAPWFGDAQLRQSRKSLLLPLLQSLMAAGVGRPVVGGAPPPAEKEDPAAATFAATHALGIFQLPVGPAPFHQLADGIGQLSLTESRKIGDDLAHQIQFAEIGRASCRERASSSAVRAP